MSERLEIGRFHFPVSFLAYVLQTTSGVQKSMKSEFEAKWRAERERKTFLALADGAVFHGVAFGARTDRCGEVVFNTGMCGYQEILTDPSYAGQFVTLTAAEVGNYGVNPEDVESRGLFLSGLVIGDLTEPSNYRATQSLDAYLKANGVPGIYGVDTRALTIHLREHGNQKAWLHVEEEGKGKKEEGGRRVDKEEGKSEDNASFFVEKARAWEGLDGQDYARRVSCKEKYEFEAEGRRKREEGRRQEGRSSVAVASLSRGPRKEETDDSALLPSSFFRLPSLHVVCYDFGVKTNILRELSAFARVTVVPAQTPAAEVLAMQPDGVFLSNGPADPAAVGYAIENIRAILSHDQAALCGHEGREGLEAGRQKVVPLMGICLGHQLLSLACGAKTGRLKFGHHGCNHPVKNLATGKVEITSQNHNFAVLPDSVPDCLEVTHVNLNDGSVEGVRHRTLPAFSVQYHPESCPGPHDSKYLFDQFKTMLEMTRRPCASQGT